MTDAKTLWVIVEQRNGLLERSIPGLLTEGKKLAQKTGQVLEAVLLGHELEALLPTVAQHGPSKIYLAQSSHLTHYSPRAYTSVLSEMIEEHKPETVLMAATSTGRDLAPFLASRLKIGLAQDVVLIDVSDEGLLVCQRPTHGGKIYTHSLFNQQPGPSLITMRPSVLEADELRAQDGVEVIEVKVTLSPEEILTRVIKHIKADPATVDLSEAEVIVAGGRGVGTSRDFQLIEELATLIGGSVGGSRVAVDEGWLPFKRQVGQTGKTVAPKLYIACGISGAIQHQLGMKDSEIIIAINMDKNAPIFKLADFGILGDLKEVIPALCSVIKETRAKHQTVT